MAPVQSTSFKVFSALAVFVSVVNAGWGNNDEEDDGTINYALFSNALSREWLYTAQGLSVEVHGCLYSFINDKDDEDVGCLEEGSEDGTDVWYQMSNCRRAQVVWSVYASDNQNSPSCNANNFKESFVTTTSVNDFLDYIGNYYALTEDDYGGYYPICGGENNGNRELFGDDRERKLGGAQGISCSSDGQFQIEEFYDNYCLTRTGSVVNELQSLNKDIQKMNCVNVYGGNNRERREQEGNIVQYLISISQTCTTADSGFCQDSEAAEERHSHSGSSGGASVFKKHPMSAGGKTWFTKLKYVTGGLLLLASFVMFTGILFTNRRRRRALMQRKYRQAKRNGRSGRSVDGRSRRSSRSASKHRDSSSRKSSSRSRRSKSRDRNSSTPRKSKDDGEGGVMT